MGEALVLWSARIFVALYVLRLAIDALSQHPRRAVWALEIWTLAFLVYVLHMTCAFAFMHHWSHAEAVAHAVKRTYEVVGLSWGGGIGINYLFTAFWLTDVVWGWIRVRRGETEPPALYWAVQGIFLFMMLNATVVFGPPFWKWVAAAVVAVLLALRILLAREPEPARPAGETSRTP